MSKYINIHTHSAIGSLRDAMLKPEELYQFCQNNDMTFTITDHGSIASYPKIWNLQKKYNTVKPIYGCEFYTNYKRDRMFDIKKRITELEELKTDSLTKEQKNNYLEELKELKQEFEEIKKYNHLVVFAKNTLGFYNLIELHNQGFTKGFYGKPTITHEELFDVQKDKNGDRGLIVTSACLAGVIPQHILKDKYNYALDFAGTFKEEFNNDFYLEYQSNGLEMQRNVNEGLKKISEKLKIKGVISTDSHYLDESYNKAHEILLLIQGKQLYSDLGKKVYRVTYENHKGETTRKKLDFDDEFKKINAKELKEGMILDKEGNQKKERDKLKAGDIIIKKIEITDKVWTIETNLVLKNEEDIKKTIKQYKHEELKDIIDELVETNKSIYNQIEEINIDREVKLPKFKDDYKTIKEKCAKKLIELGHGKNKEYIDRLKYELSVINNGGFNSYFLILEDVINFSKNNNIPMGCARGSSGGSLVAYLLGITRIDPIEWNFPFERFLTTERAGKLKLVAVTKEDGTVMELREEQEIKIIRDGKKLKIQAKNLKENDELV